MPVPDVAHVDTAAEAMVVRSKSVPVPVRLAKRPRDHRGFVVPFFVVWMKDSAMADEHTESAEPDFRIVDHNRMVLCINRKLCWLCGDPLGIHLGFVLGPMCCINRLISEPPAHRECAEYALKVCPFLSRPRMRRNEHELPDHVDAAGLPALRNPGTMALWMTRSYQVFQPHAGNPGVLFRIGPWEQVSWWRETRLASRAEALQALEDGYQLLKVEAAKEGDAALGDLERMTAEAMRTLPP